MVVMKKFFLAAGILAAGMLLAGCRGNGDIPQAAVAEDAQGNKIVGMARRLPDDRTYDKVLDMTVPFQYGDRVHRTYMDMYWAAAPLDAPAMAAGYWPEYRREADGFRRQDMLKTRKKELEALYQSVQAVRDVAVITPVTTEMGPYDARQGGFVMQPIPDVGLYQVRRGNGQPDSSVTFGVQVLSPAMRYDTKPYLLVLPEEEARRVEAYLAGKRRHRNEKIRLQVQVNGYVADAVREGSAHYAIIVPDHIVLLDMKERAPVLTIPEAMLPAVLPVSYERLPYLPASVRQAFEKKFGIGQAS